MIRAVCVVSVIYIVQETGAAATSSNAFATLACEQRAST